MTSTCKDGVPLVQQQFYVDIKLSTKSQLQILIEHISKSIFRLGGEMTGSPNRDSM
jgi:hypothetical protein